MNPRLIATIAFALAVPARADNAAQSALALRDGYVQFRGGSAQLERLSVVERIGTAQFFGPTGKELGSYHTCVAYPNAIAIRLDFPTLQVAERWSENAGAESCVGEFTSCQPANRQKTDELRVTARVANREILYSNHNWTNGRVESEADGVARVTFGDSYYRFHAFSGRLLEQGSGDRRRVYADWRFVGGVGFPYRIEDYYRDEPRMFIQLSLVTSGSEPSRWCQRNLAAVTRAP